MQIGLRIFAIITLLLFSGCVSFNSLNLEKRENAKNESLCLNLEFKVLTRGKNQSDDKIVDLEEVRLNKVRRTLDSLKIDTACTSAGSKKMIVLANDKTSIAMPIFAGITSIFTVLSLGIIPTYYAGSMELILMDGDRQLLSREFSFSTAIWLPFVIKQWRDDSKAFELYQVDARSAVLGLEVGKLLNEYRSAESLK